jgi:hypothetical protein
LGRRSFLILRRVRRLRRNTLRKLGRRCEVVTKDLFERAIATFIQAFLAVYVVGSTDSLKAAGVAGAAALLSFIKGLAASRFGDGSASVVS